MTDPTSEVSPALTPEQWEARDYRQVARDLDVWDEQKPERRDADDPTQYVAKIALTYDGCVAMMSRAHEWVSVPPPARRALAALALHEQPFGFTHEDVDRLHRAADALQAPTGSAAQRGTEARAADVLRSVAARIAALLPPRAHEGWPGHQ